MPTTHQRRNLNGGGPGRTPGDDSNNLRGQLKPRKPALRTSHFPDPPVPPYNSTAAGTLTQRGATLVDAAISARPILDPDSVSVGGDACGSATIQVP